MLKFPKKRNETLGIQVVLVSFNPGRIFGSIFTETLFCAENEIETEHSVELY